MRKLILILAFIATPLVAQTAAEEPSPIQDNSFLVEEAYNQEAGVVQHAMTFSRAANGRDWVSTFTQEWPVVSLRHQLSYTVPMQQNESTKGVGDLLINYRYQLIGDGESRLAIAPRVTLMIPTGNERRGLGSGAAGLQLMLPVSTVLTSHLVAHWNVGASFTPARDLRQYVAAQSLVWLAHERVNPLIEFVWTRNQSKGAADQSVIVSPGIRWSYNLPRHVQIVPGVAFPITVSPRTERSVYLYFSIEHPFSGKQE